MIKLSDKKLLWLFFILFISLILQSCAQRSGMKGQEEVLPLKSGRITIAAVGDVMMHSSIQKVAVKKGNNYDFLFEKVSPYLGSADITFANLETPIDHSSGVSGYPRFNARPELVGSLKKVGVEVVSLANNHIMDQGVQGLKNTLYNLHKAGVTYVGVGRTKHEAAKITYRKAHGLRIAFLAYTYNSNKHLPPGRPSAPGVNILRMNSQRDLHKVVRKVQEARMNADLVVVSLHWGIEYRKEPTAWQKKAAAHIMEAGADIILGHHPHVLQPIEWYTTKDARRGVIAYSLGNFISSQNYGVSFENKDHFRARRGDGVILIIKAEKEKEKTAIRRVDWLPIWSHRDTVGKYTVYRPVVLTNEIARLKAMPLRDEKQEETLQLFSHRLQVINENFNSLSKN